MADTFKAGDVVELKSRSPKMTVHMVSNDGNVSCTWYDFNTNTRREQIKFSAVILKLSA